MVGGTPTIADVALFSAIALSRDFGIDHDEFAALRRWMDHVRTLPGFITMPGIPSYHLLAGADSGAGIIASQFDETCPERMDL